MQAPASLPARRSMSAFAMLATRVRTRMFGMGRSGVIRKGEARFCVGADRSHAGDRRVPVDGVGAFDRLGGRADGGNGQFHRGIASGNGSPVSFPDARLDFNRFLPAPPPFGRPR